MNPSFILASCVLAFALNSQATEIIRITDGATAKCSGRVDEMRYKTSAIYRPVSIEKLADEKARLTIEFLKCSQERGEFGFSVESEVRNRTVVLERGPFRQEETTVTIQRDDLKVVVYDEQGVVLDTAPLKQASGDTYSAVIELKEDNLLFNIHSKVKLTDEATGKVIDSGRDVSGSYRLRFN